MSRSAALLTALALLLAACGGATGSAVPSDGTPAVASGWGEPFDQSFLSDPSTPFLGGELISYGHDNSADLALRPAEFGGQGSGAVARPRVLYSDGSESGTRFLLDAVLETAYDGSAYRDVLAVSSGAEGHFVATTWATSTQPCTSLDGVTCPGDTTALYWTDGAKTVRLADLTPTETRSSVLAIALVRDGDRSAACLLRADSKNSEERTLLVSCFEGASTTPRETTDARVAIDSTVKIVGVGATLYIYNDLNGDAELYAWAPFGSASTPTPLDLAAATGSEAGAAGTERSVDLVRVRSSSGNATVALFVTEAEGVDGENPLFRTYILDADGPPALLSVIENDNPTPYRSHTFSAFEVGTMLYYCIHQQADGPLVSSLFGYDLSAASSVTAPDIERQPLWNHRFLDGDINFILSGESLWEVSSGKVNTISREGVVERDSRADAYELDFFVSTGTPGEAYLGQRTKGSGSELLNWFYLAPGAAAELVTGQAAGFPLDAGVNGGTLYLLQLESNGNAGLVTIDGTTVGRLDLIPGDEEWSFSSLYRVGDRLVGTYTRVGEAAVPGYLGTLVRLVAISPR
jgi:hypothetical protein